MKILLIEDSETDRHALEKAFMAAAFDGTLVWAQNADEAWNSIPKEMPDLIFLDLNMPGKDGRELLGEIKASSYSSIPIIILSSSTALSDICHCYRGAASSYFSKPMSFRELKDLVRRICDFWKDAQLCRPDS